MKVGVNKKTLDPFSSVDNDKPAPVWPAVIAAFAAIAGAAISAYSTSEENDEQRSAQEMHDFEIASYNYGLRQKEMLFQKAIDKDLMEVQNKYQVEQWERENAYNDPVAVRERFRRAGLNARAAFGTGAASGAGIAGGLSAAPSGGSSSSSNFGSSSSLMRPSAFSNIGSLLSNGVSNAVTTHLRAEQTNADIAKTSAETSGILINNLTQSESNLLSMEETRSRIKLNLSKSDLTDAERDVEVKRLEQIDADIAHTKDNINLLREKISSEKARTSNINAATEESTERTKQLRFENEFSERWQKLPVELFTSIPGLISVIATSAGIASEQVAEAGVPLLGSLAKGRLPNGEPIPDPVRDFVKKNWNVLVDKLNDIDKKNFNGSTKPLKKMD